MIEEATRERGLIAAMEEARQGSERTRLVPLEPVKMDPLSAFIAAYHIGDPLDPLDGWRPFLRKRRLERKLARVERSGRRQQGRMLNRCRLVRRRSIWS